MKHVLATLSDAELAALAGIPAPVVAPAVPPPPPEPLPSTPPAPTPGEAWRHVSVVDGLQLQWRDGVPAIRKLVEAILRDYGP